MARYNFKFTDDLYHSIDMSVATGGTMFQDNDTEFEDADFYGYYDGSMCEGAVVSGYTDRSDSTGADAEICPTCGS